MILNKLSASTIVMALVSILSWTPAEAQDTTIRTKKQAELIVPRPAFQPVQSMDGSKADAMDTLDTADPGVKILLFSDYTWKYYKDPSYALDSKVFSDNWEHECPDPYRYPLRPCPMRSASG